MAPQKNRQEPASPARRKLTRALLHPRWQWFGRLRKLGLTFSLSVLGLLITIYSIRPILSVESIGPPSPGDMGDVNATIRLGGAVSVTNLSVYCSTNKVIVADRYGLVLHRIASVEEYQQSHLETGDSFTVRCPVGWSLAIDKNRENAYWVMGVLVPKAWALVIPFRLVDGFPDDRSFIGIKGMRLRVEDFPNLDIYNATQMDGTVDIHYSWSFLNLKGVKTFRVTGSAERPDQMEWKVVPKDDPPIADPLLPGGFITRVDLGGKGFAITMVNRGFHP